MEKFLENSVFLAHLLFNIFLLNEYENIKPFPIKLM